MTPLLFLALMMLVTAIAGAAQYVVRQRHVARLRALASQWKMHYSAADRFRLAPRVAQRIPVPGAAAVRVADLLYGIERDRYRYFFAAEYTTGVLRTKTGVRRVGTFSEPRDPSTGTPPDEMIFAPDNLPVIEQYRHLHNNISPAVP